LKRSINGIERAFRDVTVFTFPYPGGEIATASESQGVWKLQGMYIAANIT